MADRLSKDEFEKLWRRWIHLCYGEELAREVKSPTNNPYPTFGSQDDGLIVGFAMLIDILMGEFSYGEDDMESAARATLDFLCPKLEDQTSRENENWKKSRKKKWDSAMVRVFGHDDQYAKKYSAGKFKKDLEVVERVVRVSESEQPLIIERPEPPKDDGYKTTADTVFVDDADLLKELGVDDE
jgi:hypothetical protein